MIVDGAPELDSFGEELAEKADLEEKSPQKAQLLREKVQAVRTSSPMAVRGLRIQTARVS